MTGSLAEQGDLLVLVPTGKPAYAPEEVPDQRHESPPGAPRLGILDEGWGRPYFEAMKPFFQEHWGPAVEIRYWKKPLMSAPSPEHLIEEVAQSSDAVLVGVGH